MQIWIILWKRTIKRGLLLPQFLLTSEQLGMTTLLVKASLERLLFHEDKLTAQNKTIQTANVPVLEWGIKCLIFTQFYRKYTKLSIAL